MQERRQRRPVAVRHLRLAVAAAQPWPDDAGGRVGLGELDQSPQGPGRHEGVVVEEEQVAAAGQAGGLVVGPREAEVRGVADQDDLGEVAGHHVRGAVGRGVVDDDRFEADALRLVEQRFEAGAEQVAAIPVGDADRDVDGPGVEEAVDPGGAAGVLVGGGAGGGRGRGECGGGHHCRQGIGHARSRMSPGAGGIEVRVRAESVRYHGGEGDVNANRRAGQSSWKVKALSWPGLTSAARPDRSGSRYFAGSSERGWE